MFKILLKQNRPVNRIFNKKISKLLNEMKNSDKNKKLSTLNQPKKESFKNSDDLKQTQILKTDLNSSNESLKIIGKSIDALLERCVNESKLKQTKDCSQIFKNIKSSELIEPNSKDSENSISKIVNQNINDNEKQCNIEKVIVNPFIVCDEREIIEPAKIQPPVSKLLDNLGLDGKFRLVQGRIVPKTGNPIENETPQECNFNYNDKSSVKKDTVPSIDSKEVANKSLHEPSDISEMLLFEKDIRTTKGEVSNSFEIKKPSVNIEGSDGLGVIELRNGLLNSVNLMNQLADRKEPADNVSAQLKNDLTKNSNKISEQNQLEFYNNFKGNDLKLKSNDSLGIDLKNSEKTTLEGCTIRKITKKTPDIAVSGLPLENMPILNQKTSEVSSIDSRAFSIGTISTIKSEGNSLGIRIESEEISTDLNSLVIHISMPKKDKPVQIKSKDNKSLTDNISEKSIHGNTPVSEDGFTLQVNKDYKIVKSDLSDCSNASQVSSSSQKTYDNSLTNKTLDSEPIEFLVKMPDFITESNVKSELGNLKEDGNVLETTGELVIKEVVKAENRGDNTKENNKKVKNSDTEYRLMENSHSMSSLAEESTPITGLISKLIKGMKSNSERKSIISEELRSISNTRINKEELPEKGHVKKLIEYFESTTNQN